MKRTILLAVAISMTGGVALAQGSGGYKGYEAYKPYPTYEQSDAYKKLKKANPAYFAPNSDNDDDDGGFQPGGVPAGKSARRYGTPSYSSPSYSSPSYSSPSYSAPRYSAPTSGYYSGSAQPPPRRSYGSTSRGPAVNSPGSSVVDDLVNGAMQAGRR